MTLLLIAYSDRVPIWRDAFRQEMPELKVEVWPDVDSAEQVEFVLSWAAEPGTMARFPGLRGIFSLGAGVDHILRDPALPPHVPVVRMVDSSLSNAITQYILLAVLRQHRNLDAYQDQQNRGVWKKIGISNLNLPRLGILGLGELGARAARALAELGYPVSGWSRTAKTIAGVTTYSGPDGLKSVLETSDILVSVLPYTSETEGILNADLFARLPKGAHVINVGRGEHLVEADLIAALDSGHLAGATLDVFRQEPLPTEHPLWRHPRVIVTPHDGGDTIPRTAVRGVVANIARIRNGQAPVGLVDRQTGY
jgi:glyoxylate/hydroxypyruvate reductase A